jgi:hypothetical protein
MMGCTSKKPRLVPYRSSHSDDDVEMADDVLPMA